MLITNIMNAFHLITQVIGLFQSKFVIFVMTNRAFEFAILEINTRN